MSGDVAQWAFPYVTPLTSVRVVSYGEFVNFRPVPQPPPIDPKQYQAALQAIGHLYDPSKNLTPLLDEDETQKAAQPLPPEKWGLYAYYNDLGVQLRQQGKISDSLD